MKFLLTYSSMGGLGAKKRIIEIKSLKDLFNLAKKEKNPLIIDFGSKQIAYIPEKKLKGLDGVIEIYDNYGE